MGESLGQIRDRLRLERASRVGAPTRTDVLAPAAEPAAPRETFTGQETAFVVDGPEHTVITGPAHVLSPEKAAAWEKASVANPLFKYLQGRFVEADRPNRNNAMWTTADLEMGQATVAGGPLNWLHNDRKIVGALLDSQMVYPPEAAAAGHGNHIVAMAALWEFMYPRETRVVEAASKERALWYSMECAAQTVTCVDAPGYEGCGETFDWQTYKRETAKVCGHLQRNSCIRRLGDPTFIGGAIIVPPVRPGWANASAEVMGQAGRVAEAAGLDDVMSRKEAEAMVAMVMDYAGAGQPE
jgi:hypothetical protein